MALQFDLEDTWQQLIARSWSDPVLKEKLIADPEGVLEAEGLSVPAGVTVRVLENTDKVVNLVLPLKPAPSELSEEELQGITNSNCGVSNCDCRGICGCNERC
jgi:Nitrile hydratase, alpha chain